MQNPEVPIVAIVVFIVLFFAVIAVLWIRNTRLADEVDNAENERDGARERLRHMQEQVRQVQEKFAALEAEKQKHITWLDTADNHLKALKEELDARPKVERSIYRILTVGMKATGKSSLTLKWANPLVDLGTIEATKMERYERTVSLVKSKQTYTEHVFEVYDWGGEHIVDAQEQLARGEIDGRKGDIHGILMVVDLGGRDAQQVDEHRVAQQIEMFNPHTLQFFLSTNIVRACKTIVLFINKSDLIPGPPAHAEAHAREYFFPLIQALNAHANKLDVKVIVGSASFGHSTHVLFSHFVQQILPDGAFDHQLVQRMKGAEPRRRTQTLTPGINGGIPGIQDLPAPPVAAVSAASRNPSGGQRGGGQAPPAPANASLGPNRPPVPHAPAPVRQGTARIGQINPEGSQLEETIPYKNSNVRLPPRKA